MADLPIELWHSIFEHLHDLVDLYSCARVCKALYLEVKAYRIREIAFIDRDFEWLHYGKTSITNHKYQTDFEDTLTRSSFNFDYLRHLTISGMSSIDLNEINRFVHLEQLDIDLAYKERKIKSTLSLANLKVLAISAPYNLPCLQLDTPRLAKVYTFSLKKLEFVYPESVKCIQTSNHDRKLSTFRNLECLNFTDIYFTMDVPAPVPMEFSVEGLEKLKEIDFNYRRSTINKRNIERFKSIIEKLLALRRPDLKVFWLNVQVTDPDLLTKYEHMYWRLEQYDGNLVVFQFKHYEKLKGKVDFLGVFWFNQSMKRLSEAGFNVKSGEFISKFPAVFSFRRMIIRDEVVESELLMMIIASSPNLSRLHFIDSGLGQSFFDRMADTIRLNGIPLRTLILMNFNPNESLNFDFVCRLYQLETFRTNLQVSNELVSKLLRLLRLTEISINPARISKRIWRSRGKYHLDGESLSLLQLLERFN